MTGFRSGLFGLASLVLGACASPPDVEAALGADPVGSDYPALLPIEDIIGDLAAPDPASAEAQARVDARVSALRSRAATLRQMRAP